MGKSLCFGEAGCRLDSSPTTKQHKNTHYVKYDFRNAASKVSKVFVLCFLKVLALEILIVANINDQTHFLLKSVTD